MLKTFGLILYTELLLLMRRSQEWLYAISFFVIVICFFPFAFSVEPATLQKLIPGSIWITALLASLLAADNIFVSDLEEGYLEQLLLSPVPLPFLLTAKLIAQWLVCELPLICLTPVLGILFHLSFTTISLICLGLLLGTPILTLIGSLGVALTLGLRQQGVLLSVLILPLLAPILIFGVNIIKEAEAGFDITGPIAFLAALSLLSVTTLPFAIAAALRTSLDD